MNKNLTIDGLRKSQLIAYEYVRGSNLYNLQNDDGSSDLDIGGVYIAPIGQILGMPKYYQSQVSDETNDTTFYEVATWLELLVKSNPNALESLYIPKDKIIGEVHPAIQLIIDNRDKFLTKECFKPFIGYAVTQIEKARGLNKKIVNPVVERKTIIDFCYTTYNYGSTNITRWLNHRGLKQEYCGLVAIPNMRDLYGVYYDWGMHKEIEISKDPKYYNREFIYKFESYNWDKVKTISDENGNEQLLLDLMPKPIGYKGIAKLADEETGTNESNEVRLSSIAKDVEPICYLSYNKDGYIKHCKDYREYKEWEQKRNKKRYVIDEQYGYNAKNVSHCFRLFAMGLEIARGEGFNVVRTHDRDFLMDIKNHKYTYDELIKRLEVLKGEMEQAMVESTLPDTVDDTFVQELLIEVRRLAME